MIHLPPDYEDRVYAGVLGKVIGVYLGRPFEGCTCEALTAEFGEINYYVHERRGVPLVVTDDDISGTFTFLRAMSDYGCRSDITAEQIGRTWLNYLIEKRTILWWGGLGNSTEHTAYLRLKRGIPAPLSGAAETNGKVVAEQIGAQIFIDGWGLIAPGQPERAADLARRAASVSHDGEAIYAAQVVAALVARAFVERNIDCLLDTAVALIPRDCLIYRMIADLREWHAAEPDWRKTREMIVERYGYDRYGGNCHVVPNHALIIHALLHGDGDFQRSLKIVNTCGWDTDCNSGNVGCILGVRNGLAGIDAGPDWRGPVADRIYLPSADGGRCVTDAVQETYRIVNIARALFRRQPLAPKDGARFHFELPGSVQGFQPDLDPDSKGTASVWNVEGHSEHGMRSLAVRYRRIAAGRPARVVTPTFAPPEALSMPGYDICASPTLYSGQEIRAAVGVAASNKQQVLGRLYLRHYDASDRPVMLGGPAAVLSPGERHVFAWRAPDTGGLPIVYAGLEISSEIPAEGSVYLDYLTWDGPPDVTFKALPAPAAARAWTNGVDHFDGSLPGEGMRLVQDEGTGLLIQGCREWRDYKVSADVTPHMAAGAGLAARVQGMRRYYALMLCAGGEVRLVKALDGIEVLACKQIDWQPDTRFDLALTVSGSRILAEVDAATVFDIEDQDRPLTEGAIGLVCEEGRTATTAVRVQPIA